MNQYPQLLAYPSNGQPAKVPNMLVVGGVQVPSGDLSRGSRTDPPGTSPRLIALYAPSEFLNLPLAAGGWRNPLEVVAVSYGRESRSSPHEYPSHEFEKKADV